MRASTLLLCIAAISMLVENAAAREFPEGNPRWLVLEGKGAATPEIVTVLGELPDPAMRARFPVLLQIAWGYASLPNGMPPEAEIVRGRELYANLDRIIGQGGIYAMSRTGGGGRTMYYYVQSTAAHSESIRRYFDSLPPISVKVIARDEPEWTSVKEVLDGVK